MKKNRRRFQWPEDPKWWAVRHTGTVAAELGCHRNAAYKHRVTRGLPSPPLDGGPGAPQRVKDEEIDMTASASENAKRLGCGASWMKVRMDRIRARAKKKGKKKSEDWA